MKNKFLHSLSKLTALFSVFVLVGMSFTARVAAADEPYDTYNLMTGKTWYIRLQRMNRYVPLQERTSPTRGRA